MPWGVFFLDGYQFHSLRFLLNRVEASCERLTPDPRCAAGREDSSSEQHFHGRSFLNAALSAQNQDA